MFTFSFLYLLQYYHTKRTNEAYLMVMMMSVQIPTSDIKLDRYFYLLLFIQIIRKN